MSGSAALKRALALALASGLLVGLLLGPALRTVWRAQDAKLAVGLHVAWVSDDGAGVSHTQLDPANPERIDAGGTVTRITSDPWGRPWVVRGASPRATVYSLGPNGADDGGAGDDVILLSPRQSIYIDGDFNARAEIYRDLPWLLGLLAALVAAALAAGAWWPARASAPAELAVAALCCAPLWLFAGGVYLLRPGVPHTLNLLGERLVPLTLAPPAWGSAGALCLGVLALVGVLRGSRRRPTNGLASAATTEA